MNERKDKATHYIKESFRNSGLRKNEIAHVFGISRAAINAWERGKNNPSIPDFLKILELGGMYSIQLNKEE